MTVHFHKEAHPDVSVPDPHQDAFSRVTLGFWIYLMTDCLIFCTLFATYAVLHNSTFGGPTTRDLYSLPIAFSETMVLLCSSVTSGLGLLAALKRDKNRAVFWLIFAFLFGASFIAMELTEFHKIAHEGHDWTHSAFLSSFFTLVGTHGLHVSIGLTWMSVMILQIFFLGITIDTFRRLVVFSLFWHFLDLVWIFIFTFVYLIGVI
ncbi:MAG TPA: cytochrome o ubiquinol oxidase subunit III [Chlamydiales bacterium]|nr:cytochrome o ubiquinol oxidase subunit III [Chlamydiales bacterium]